MRNQLGLVEGVIMHSHPLSVEGGLLLATESIEIKEVCVSVCVSATLTHSAKEWHVTADKK